MNYPGDASCSCAYGGIKHPQGLGCPLWGLPRRKSNTPIFSPVSWWNLQMDGDSPQKEGAAEYQGSS